jgi:hypothetical protein
MEEYAGDGPRIEWPRRHAGGVGAVRSYERVADLPVTVAGAELAGRQTETSYGFTRPTTVVRLRGPDGAVGVGEDVTTDPNDHERFQRVGAPDLAGTHTLDGFADHITRFDPVRSDGDSTDWNEPGRARQWALESAALDLGLRQAGQTLGERLSRSYDPVRFVVSLRLSDPPRLDLLEGWRSVDPSLEFKLDVAPDWDPAFVDAVAGAAGDAVRVLDFKASGGGDDDRVTTDPRLYRRVVETFPDATLEDPLLSGPCWEAVADERARCSFDGAITGVESIGALPFEPRYLNLKPARFGSVASLFDAIDYALDRDVTLYGGGMFELDRGRSHLHALASLFYPDGPNDVAPPAYNEPEPSADVPASPLSPPADPAGPGF